MHFGRDLKPSLSPSLQRREVKTHDNPSSRGYHRPFGVNLLVTFSPWRGVLQRLAIPNIFLSLRFDTALPLRQDSQLDGLELNTARLRGKSSHGKQGRAAHLMAKKKTSKRTSKKTNSGNMAAEHKARIAACRRAMRKAGLSAYLISTRMDWYYLTGFTGEDSALLITAKDVHLITDGRFEEAVNIECPWISRTIEMSPLAERLAGVLKKLRIKKLGFQDDGLSVGTLAGFKKKSRGVKWEPAPPIVADLRIRKDDADLKMMKKSLTICEAAFQSMCEQIRLGMTELEVAAILEKEMKVRGSLEPAFTSIVAEGPNGALPHAFPGRRKIRKGSAVLVDWGARYSFYCSDLTRMVFVGSIPPKIAEIYEIVLEAQVRAVQAVKPGMKLSDLDAVARNYITEHGYGKEYNHSLGHGLGLDVHELPGVRKTSMGTLKSGMVITVEPGIYLPGVGGVRIEDDVLVTAKGHKVLSKLSKAIDDAVIPASK